MLRRSHNTIVNVNVSPTECAVFYAKKQEIQLLTYIMYVDNAAFVKMIGIWVGSICTVYVFQLWCVLPKKISVCICIWYMLYILLYMHIVSIFSVRRIASCL